MLLHGKGGEVDKDGPTILATLEVLYKIIEQYEPSNIYNMDETELFVRLVPRYTIPLPTEDM